jgi:hypothetical protein
MEMIKEGVGMNNFVYLLAVSLSCMVGTWIGMKINKRRPLIIGLSIATVMPIGWVFVDGSAMFLIATPIFALVLGICQRHQRPPSAGVNL